MEEISSRSGQAGVEDTQSTTERILSDPVPEDWRTERAANTDAWFAQQAEKLHREFHEEKQAAKDLVQRQKHIVLEQHQSNERLEAFTAKQDGERQRAWQELQRQVASAHSSASLVPHLPHVAPRRAVAFLGPQIATLTEMLCARGLAASLGAALMPAATTYTADVAPVAGGVVRSGSEELQQLLAQLPVLWSDIGHMLAGSDVQAACISRLEALSTCRIAIIMLTPEYAASPQWAAEAQLLATRVMVTRGSWPGGDLDLAIILRCRTPSAPPPPNPKSKHASPERQPKRPSAPKPGVTASTAMPSALPAVYSSGNGVLASLVLPTPPDGYPVSLPMSHSGVRDLPPPTPSQTDAAAAPHAAATAVHGAAGRLVYFDLVLPGPGNIGPVALVEDDRAHQDSHPSPGLDDAEAGSHAEAAPGGIGSMEAMSCQAVHADTAVTNPGTGAWGAAFSRTSLLGTAAVSSAAAPSEGVAGLRAVVTGALHAVAESMAAVSTHAVAMVQEPQVFLHPAHIHADPRDLLFTTASTTMGGNGSGSGSGPGTCSAYDLLPPQERMQHSQSRAHAAMHGHGHHAAGNVGSSGAAGTHLATLSSTALAATAGAAPSALVGTAAATARAAAGLPGPATAAAHLLPAAWCARPLHEWTLADVQVWLRSLGRNMSRLWPALGALGMDGPALVCALQPGSDLPLLLGASLPPTRPNPYATGGNAGCVNGAPGKVPASLGMAAGGMPRGAGTALMGSGGMGLNALLTGRLEPWLLDEAKRAAALMQALAAVVKSTSPSSKQAPGASMVNGSPCQNTTSNTQVFSAQHTSFANGSPQAPLTSNIPPLSLSSLHAVTTATTTGASSSEGGALPPPAYCRTPAPACHLSPLVLGLLLADTFRYYDADADGYLDERKMSQLVQWSGLPLRQEQARELLYELDHDDDKVLSWHEAVPLLLDIWALTLAHADVAQWTHADAMHLIRMQQHAAHAWPSPQLGMAQGAPDTAAAAAGMAAAGRLSTAASQGPWPGAMSPQDPHGRVGTAAGGSCGSPGQLSTAPMGTATTTFIPGISRNALNASQHARCSTATPRLALNHTASVSSSRSGTGQLAFSHDSTVGQTAQGPWSMLAASYDPVLHALLGPGMLYANDQAAAGLTCMSAASASSHTEPQTHGPLVSPPWQRRALMNTAMGGLGLGNGLGVGWEVAAAALSGSLQHEVLAGLDLRRAGAVEVHMLREALAQRHVSLGLTPLDMQRLALLSEGLADATATATADSITHYWHASTSTYIHPEGSIHSCGNAFLTRPSHAYSTTPGGIAVLSGTALEAEVVLAAMEGMRGRELDAHAWMEMAVQTVHGGSAELLREVYGVIVPQQPGCRYARQPPPADSADGAVQGMVQLLNAMYRKAVAAAGATAAGGDATAACGATGSSDRDVESEVLDPRAARAALLGLAKLQGLELSMLVQLVLLPQEHAESADASAVQPGLHGGLLAAAKHDPLAWSIVTAHVLYVYRELRLLVTS